MAVFLVSVAACAGGAPITLRNAWVRPAPDVSQETAAYLDIVNTGSSDALVAVESPDATAVQIHQTIPGPDGMAAMQMTSRLEIPAGATVPLAVGGTHLMVTGLKTPLLEGDGLELRLRFEHAGVISIRADVRQG
jgi:copper(I)-binding protein